MSFSLIVYLPPKVLCFISPFHEVCPSVHLHRCFFSREMFSFHIFFIIFSITIVLISLEMLVVHNYSHSLLLFSFIFSITVSISAFFFPQWFEKLYKLVSVQECDFCKLFPSLQCFLCGFPVGISFLALLHFSVSYLSYFTIKLINFSFQSVFIYLYIGL